VRSSLKTRPPAAGRGNGPPSGTGPGHEPESVREEMADRFRISTDPSLLDLDVIHGFLTRSYWATGIPRERVERSIRGSLCFGLYAEDGEQAGFARVVTDRATFAYLADVFVLEPWRGRGLSKRLVETVLAHPDLQGLRRFCLATQDAHGLYARYGFAPPADPSRWMEIVRPGLYETRLAGSNRARVQASGVTRQFLSSEPDPAEPDIDGDGVDRPRSVRCWRSRPKSGCAESRRSWSPR